MPCARACAGEPITTGLPSMRITPAVAGTTPNSASATLLRPEPTSPGEAEDLARAQLEADAAEDALDAEVLDRQHHVADRHGLLREHLRDFAADHHLDDLVARHVGWPPWCAMYLPSRNTDTSSAISNSSFILCVM